MKKPIKIKSVKLKPKIRSGMTINALYDFHFQELNKQPGVKSLMKSLRDL